MSRIGTSTQLCAVIGNPVGHSLSPAMHNAAFEALGLDYVYLAFQVQDVGACIGGMRALPAFRGMSVTIPHKVSVMPHLDAVVPLARQVGCVNTVTQSEGKLVGSITDGLGTLRAFAEAGVPISGKEVLFVGSGGAVRAVAFAFLECAEAAQITILGRTPKHVAALVEDLNGLYPGKAAGGRLAEDLEACMQSHDVLVQGTSVGMYPEGVGETCVPAAYLRRDQAVFDMVYRPLKTRLVEDAEAAGCRVIPGIEMLLQQAVLQFETWTEREAPVEVMRRALLQAAEAQ